jgi:hypothetical protein
MRIFAIPQSAALLVARLMGEISSARKEGYSGAKCSAGRA